jgi:predicted CopG family antitoxin
MVTTIQIQDTTLQILKRVKAETQSRSYDDAITKLVAKKATTTSLAGFLGKLPMKEIMKDLRDKDDRF